MAHIRKSHKDLLRCKFEGPLERFLPRLELFKGVRPAVIRALAAKLKVERYEMGAVLPAQEHAQDHFWVVLEGLVERRVIASTGRIIAIDLDGPGEVFGALFQGAAVAPQVETVALAPTVIARGVTGEIRPIAARAPILIHNLVDLLRRNLREVQALRAYSIEPAERRMLWILLWLYSKLGDTLPLTRTGLAEIAGLAWETAVRALSPLEKRGWIFTRRGKVRILKPDAIVESLRATDGPAQ